MISLATTMHVTFWKYLKVIKKKAKEYAVLFNTIGHVNATFKYVYSFFGLNKYIYSLYRLGALNMIFLGGPN